MSEQIEPKRALAKAVRNASKVASNQALALDEIFNRAVKSAAPETFDSTTICGWRSRRRRNTAPY